MSASYYAGIGSRETPSDVLCAMKMLASDLEARGFILRSGHAPGADRAFESGLSKSAPAQIFLPWRAFEGSDSPLFHLDEIALASVDRYHPTPHRLSQAARCLMARNWYQVMGPSGEPQSAFIICWTKGGKVVGGTGQALRIALDKKIPIYNLALTEHREKLQLLLETLPLKIGRTP
jgi:hypothetical protein